MEQVPLIAAGPASEILIDIAAGSVGGFISEALDYPFDTAKVLLQTQKKSQQPQYTGTFDCIRQSIQRKGVMSLYQGVGSRLMCGMAENATSFLVYAGLKRELLKYKQQQAQARGDSNPVKLSLLDISLAGTGAGAVSAFVMTPGELIKCRLQVSAQMSTPRYTSTWDCIRQTVKHEGLRGLYKGHMSTIYREVPGNFSWYLTYELVADALTLPMFYNRPRDQLPVTAQLTGGAAAGIVHWILVFPIDTVKSVLQTQATMVTKRPHKTFWQILAEIYRFQGIQGLYRGFGMTALRAAPGDGLIFVGYEQTSRYLRGV